MPVKVVIKRKFNNFDLQKVSQMLVKARMNAMNHRGYIASETLRGKDDPSEIVVLSMWEKKEDWDAFKDCGPRQELEAGFKEMMDGPTECTVYTMGLSTG